MPVGKAGHPPGPPRAIRVRCTPRPVGLRGRIRMAVVFVLGRLRLSISQNRAFFLEGDLVTAKAAFHVEYSSVRDKDDPVRV